MIRPRPSAKVVRWMAGCDEEAMHVSVLTLGEIQKGIAKLADRPRRETLQSWLDVELRQRFGERVLPVTAEVALAWGQIQGEAEQDGKPLPTVDGLLAATAAAHNLVLATRNVADFQRTGVRLVNPWDGAG